MADGANQTLPQKMSDFQYSRRANWPWRDKILSAPQQENYCESKQTCFSYSLDKAFHLPEFQAKLLIFLPEIEWTVLIETAS